MIGVIVFIVSNGSAKEVDVPTVTGQSLAEATKTLEKAGLEVGRVDRVTDDNQEPNTVTGQDPQGDSKAAEGSKVNLTVTQASETFDAPSFLGMTPEQAQKTADQYGLVLKAAGEEASDQYEQGQICGPGLQGWHPSQEGRLHHLQGFFRAR